MSSTMIRRYLLSLMCLFAVAVVVPAYAGPSPSGSGPAWASLAPVPTAGGPGFGVEGMGVALLGDKIVAALGYDNSVGGDTATTRIYSIAHNTWLPNGANAPGASSEGAGTSHANLFYNIGGRTAGPGSPARADLWSYDLVSNAWTALASMSQARAGLAVAVVGDSIYAIGGRTATGGPCTGGELSVVERYDVDTDTWSTVASLPSARSDLAAATVGGKIYVFGGCVTAPLVFLNNVDVYDPKTDTWSTTPTDMPTARAAMYAVATKGGTVYVIGGEIGFAPGLSTNESYMVSTDSWTTGLLPMPTPRAETGAVGMGGGIYIIGGSQPSGGASVGANEVFKP
jgi:hypothetical protein